MSKTNTAAAAPLPTTVIIQFTVTDHESYRELKRQVVEHFEREFCTQLTAMGGTLSSIARALRMDRKHLSDLMKKHGVKMPWHEHPHMRQHGP